MMGAVAGVAVITVGIVQMVAGCFLFEKDIFIAGAAITITGMAVVIGAVLA